MLGLTVLHGAPLEQYTEVHLSGVVVTDQGFALLAEALAVNSFVKHLLLPDCYLSETGGDGRCYFGEEGRTSDKTCSALLMSAGALSLFAGLHVNTSLRSINLGENHLTARAALAFIDLLRTKPNIADVYLDWG